MCKLRSNMALLMKVVTLLIIAITVTSCGGESDVVRIKGTGDGSDEVAKPISSTGTINSNSTNSFSVNGTTYDSTDVSVLIDNKPRTIADLRVGQVVDITGGVDLESQLTSADTIRFDTSVQGEITELVDGSITVLEQDIIIYDNVSFVGEDLSSAEDLSEGDTVRISGYPLSDGRFVASYLERIPETADSIDSIISGRVDELDSLEKRFLINRLSVDYSLIDDLQLLENGMAIIVNGSLSGPEGSTRFVATALRIKQPTVLEDDTLSETQGFVTSFFSPTEFEIDGTRISADRETVYVGGDVADLQRDVLLEVEGLIDSDGRVEASRIIFLVATLANVKSGERFYSETQDLVWNTVEGAQAYRVLVKNENYQTLYEKEFSVAENTVILSDIPQNGAGIILDLQTKYNDAWLTKRYRFATANAAEQSTLTSHRYSETFLSTSETFIWKAVNAKQYTLALKSGEWRYSETFSGDVTQVTIDNIPGDSASIEASLTVTDQNDFVYIKRYLFTGMVGKPYAKINSHQYNEVLNSGDVTFAWNDVGADSYKIWVWGNGGVTFFSEIFSGDVTSALITDLPVNNSSIQFRLTTIRDGAVHDELYRFVTADIQQTAVLTSHERSDVLTSSTTTFTWSDASADRYELMIAGGFYANELHRQSYRGDVTSATIDNLPTNCALLLVYLWTYHGEHNIRFHTALISPCEQENAVLLDYKDKDVLPSTEATFRWGDVDADEYYLSIRSSAAAGIRASSSVYSSYFGKDTSSVTVTGLPENDAPLVVQLGTRHGRGWHLETYRLNSKGGLANAQLISHSEDLGLSSDTEVFEWTDVGADHYNLYIRDGSVVIFDGHYYDGTTSVSVEGLSDNVEVFLNTRHDRGWVTEYYSLGVKND